MGTVTHVEWQDQHSMTAVLVRFCSDSIGLRAKASSLYRYTDPDAVPIKKAQAAFWVRGAEGFQSTRAQFPLFLSWAVAIYK